MLLKANTPITPHSRTAKIIHWGFILVFAYALTKQLDAVDQLADAALLRFEMVFALIFLALLAARYFYMRNTRPSAIPEDAPILLKRLASLGHLAIYGSLAAIALSGMLIGTFYWLGFTDGLLIEIAVWLHEVSVSASYICIAIHVGAALFHRLMGDGIWSAMVPIFTETPKTVDPQN